MILFFKKNFNQLAGRFLINPIFLKFVKMIFIYSLTLTTRFIFNFFAIQVTKHQLFITVITIIIVIIMIIEGHE